MYEKNIYSLGGAVQAYGGVYIPRRADAELLALCREGHFVNILSSRQTGKSSLVFHVAGLLRSQGIYSVIVDLTRVGVSVTPDQWFLGILSIIEEQCELNTDVVSWWRARGDLSYVQRWILFLDEVLLKEVKAPIVIFVDEIDATLGLEFSDDFFASINAIYNSRSSNPAFRRLSFVMIGVTHPYELFRELHRSPFSFSKTIELTDFTLSEAYPLSSGFGLPADNAQQLLRWILAFTNGHPYLTQYICHEIAEAARIVWSERDVKNVVVATFFGEGGERNVNIAFVRDMLLKRAPDVEHVLLLYQEVLRGNKVHDDNLLPAVTHLKLSGIVRVVDEHLQPRNRIYREVFDETWVKRHLPVGWNRLNVLGRLRELFQSRVQYKPRTPEQIAEAKVHEALASNYPHLDLTRLGLTVLPDSIGLLKNLRVLDISDNQLRTLPESIGGLAQLHTLSVANNRLNTFPESVGELTQLRELDISYNQLQTLPMSLGHLTQLRKLIAIRNQLTALPSLLHQLVFLEQLYLQDNPALRLPPEVLGPTMAQVFSGQLAPARPSDILEYYFHNQESRPLNEAKLILVGRGGVGKTSLVKRLRHDTFDPNERKTEGINITPWRFTLRGEEILLNVWDFGGQEIMHATHQFFLTQRSLYVLVLNAREGEQDVNVEYWLRIIESFGADSPILLVINKVKDHPFDLNRRGLQAKFPAIHAFIQTDCEDGIGIDELRAEIEQAIDRLKHLRAPFPSAWFRVKNLLGGMKENFIPYDRYQEICRENGVSEQQSQDTLVDSLHHLGIVLNFKDDPRLRDTHVLNPEWATNGVYQLLNAQRLANKSGILELLDLGEILDESQYPRDKHLFVIDLMQKFELCFRFEGSEERYLIPELLGKEEPELDEYETEDSLSFQYHYNILPEGLMPRFIVRTHEMSVEQPRWRTGVVLEFDDNRALVKADVPDRKVFIWVTGPAEGRRRTLTIVRSHFNHIHRSISKLEAKEMVPIAHDAENVVPYLDLLVFEKNHVSKVPMVVNGKMAEVDVSALLNGIETKEQRRTPQRGGVFTEAKRLVYSYSHKDETLREELETHLALLKRQNFITSWHDRKILPGEQWADKIDENFVTADIILLLISSDFIASEYCYETELKMALERHRVGKARVVPVILRDVEWKHALFSELEALPKDGKPIMQWPDRDSAWKDVATGIRRVVEELQRNP